MELKALATLACCCLCLCSVNIPLAAMECCDSKRFTVEFLVEESNPLFHFEWNPYGKISVILVNIRFWIFGGKKICTSNVLNSTE